jgi:hypothetical protein
MAMKIIPMCQVCGKNRVNKNTRLCFECLKTNNIESNNVRLNPVGMNISEETKSLKKTRDGGM